MTIWEEIVDDVRGTAMSPAQIAGKWDVDEEDVEHELSLVGLENCPGCGWWWDAFELEDDYCPDCQHDEEN